MDDYDAYYIRIGKDRDSYSVAFDGLEALGLTPSEVVQKVIGHLGLTDTLGKAIEREVTYVQWLEAHLEQARAADKRSALEERLRQLDSAHRDRERPSCG